MKIEGKHNCDYCKNDFNWFYIVPKHLVSGTMHIDHAESIPEHAARLCNVIKSEEIDGYKYPLEATVHCTECDRLNTIKIEYKN